MLNPFRFFRIFFSLLASAGWVLLILCFVYFSLGLILYSAEIGISAKDSPTNLAESLYLSAITALTIGYGDFLPNSTVGRISAILLGFLGIIFTGIVVAAAIKALEKASEKTNGKG